MKWIKKFEASSLRSEVRDELKEFCEINLAYLMDDDYHVMITRRDSLPIDENYHKKGLIIHFYRWHQGNREGFNWVEVENHFIPFIQRLSKEYTIIECIIDYGATKYIIPIEDLLNGIVPKRLIERILVIVSEE